MKRPNLTRTGKPNLAEVRCGLLRNPTARLPTGSSHMDKRHTFAKRTKEDLEERFREDPRTYMLRQPRRVRNTLLWATRYWSVEMVSGM
jgi:hypothetical protein